MPVRRVGPTIGDRVHFVDGQFTGRTYRAELEELQKADLGRKYARKDRRPLDPPPVVLFKFIEILQADGRGAGESESVVENYDDFKSFGFLCHVDLFPVPAEDSSDFPKPENRKRSTSSASAPYSSSSTASTSSQYSTTNLSTGASRTSFAMSHAAPAPFSQMAYTLTNSSQIPTPSVFQSTMPQPSLPPMYSIPAPAPPSLSLQIPATSSAMSYDQQIRGYTSSAPQSDVVAYAGDYAITESSKCTSALAGATFVQAYPVEYQGKKSAMFVFPDLAVRIEGTFCMRYRVFNVFSKVWGDQEVPVLAECFGGPFRIYSTKEFPGLRASTDLTKHLALFGIRLNLRENERKRRKKSDIEAERNSQVTLAKGQSSAAGHSPTFSNSSTSTTGTSGRQSRRRKGKRPARREEQFESEESDDSDGGTQ
ncbi:velvet factor-domain-containing protein [Amylocystis lapponica]|nr:velvet factor-domain-containing protein [Amylocystis lapponica]